MLLPLVGLALLAFVLSRLDPAAVLTAATRLRPWALAGGTGLFAANVLFKGVRWRRLLDALAIHLPWRVAMVGYLHGNLFGFLTFGRVGELIRAKLLCERGVSLGRALAHSVFDRLFDLTVLVLLGGLVGGYVAGDTLLMAAVAAGLVAVALVGPPVGRRLLRAARNQPERRGWRRAITTLAELTAEMAGLVRARILAEASWWTAVGWLAHFTTVWLLARGLGISVPVIVVVAAASLAALTALLPVTYQGVGTRELVFALILGRWGVSQESAVVLALSLFLCMMASSVLLGVPALLARTE